VRDVANDPDAPTERRFYRLIATLNQLSWMPDGDRQWRSLLCAHCGYLHPAARGQGAPLHAHILTRRQPFRVCVSAHKQRRRSAQIPRRH